MRLLVPAAFLTLISSFSAYAADAPEAPPAPPRVFVAAGYTQPDITPGLCHNVSPQVTECVIPEMTAGRYLIQAGGTSTATTAEAVQQLTIQVGDTSWAQAQRRGTTASPWRVGTAQTFKMGCVTTLVTDRTLKVTVTYADQNGTKDPKGPTLSIRKLAWSGVLTTAPVTPPQ